MIPYVTLESAVAATVELNPDPSIWSVGSPVWDHRLETYHLTWHTEGWQLTLFSREGRFPWSLRIIGEALQFHGSGYADVLAKALDHHTRHVKLLSAMRCSVKSSTTLWDILDSEEKVCQ